MNIWDWIILGVIASLLLCGIRRIRKNKGMCSGCCDGCSGCDHSKK